MTQIDLLSGFLGAGKTSLLRHLLEAGPGPGTVVFVNEFGKLGLDGRLIAREGLALYELNSGCICCSLADELEDTLRRALKERRPERILIEASGVAEPAGIVRSIAGMGLALAPVRTAAVVDARMWLRQRSLGELFLSQIEAADLVVLNKTDLVPARKIPEALSLLETRFPGRRIVPAVRGAVDPALFWTREAPRAGLQEQGHGQGHGHGKGHDHHHHDGPAFAEAVFASPFPLSREGFEAFLRRLQKDVLRAKGQVLFPEGPAWLDVVDGEPSWSEPPAGPAGTSLVFIGTGLDAKALTASLQRLVIPTKA
ncbi:MAG: GTP-binding protein [Desulfovibrio sp.]|nr:GTP-binding protein [Desulfovibrio sp.]